MINVYLASGWFNQKQKEAMDKVRSIILSFDSIKLYSPFYDGKVLNSSTDSYELRKWVYDDNVRHVITSDLIIAIIDDFEPGTVFEIGSAAAINWLICNGFKINAYSPVVTYKEINPKILAYSDVPGRGLNVMLQQSVWGFSNGESQLRNQIVRFINGFDSIDYLKVKIGDII